MDKQILKKIERVRARIIESREINEKLYTKLVEELGLKSYSTDEDLLFDAVWNTSTQSDFERIMQNIKL